MTIKTIIYFDQNYLSKMAKSKLEIIKDDDNQLFWKNFYDKVTTAILEDRVICPELEFQRKEALFDSRIYKTVSKIIDSLSWDLQFNEWNSIVHNQILIAGFSFMSKDPPVVEKWKIPFNSDPYLPIAERIDETEGIFIVYSPSDQTVNEEREGKLKFVDKSLMLLKQRKSQYSNISNSEAIIRSKQATINALIGQLAVSNNNRLFKEGSSLNRLTAIYNQWELENLFSELNKIGIDMSNEKRAMEFADTLLNNCPFIDIFGSIWAIITEYYDCGRTPKGSDYYDAVILATVLPYCDIVTTDTFMKEIIVNRFKFDKKYNCQIYSENKKNREALQSTIISSMR